MNSTLMSLRASSKPSLKVDNSVLRNHSLLSSAKTSNTEQKNPGSLRGKLNDLEKTVKPISEELVGNRKATLQAIRSQISALEVTLTAQLDDAKVVLLNELNRLNDEMKRHFTYKKAENAVIQRSLDTIQSENKTVQHKLDEIDHRLFELEINIGNFTSRK